MLVKLALVQNFCYVTRMALLDLNRVFAPTFSFVHSQFFSVFDIHSTQMNAFKASCFVYSETPPYGHLGNTVTSLLRPLVWLPGKTAIHFLVKKKPSLIPGPVYNQFF